MELEKETSFLIPMLVEKEKERTKQWKNWEHSSEKPREIPKKIAILLN